MGNWTLESIAWDRFDASKVDPEILRNIKAAALVERNGGDYRIYLNRVFAGDSANFKALPNGCCRETRIVFDAAKALFFKCRNEFAVADEDCRDVRMMDVDAEDVHVQLVCFPSAEYW